MVTAISAVLAFASVQSVVSFGVPWTTSTNRQTSQQRYIPHATINCNIQSASPSRARRSSTQLYMEPLGSEGTWAAYFDEDNSGLVYYFNSETGESIWTPPSTTFPTVQLTREQLQIMQDKNGNVNLLEQGVAQLEDAAKAGTGFFSSILNSLKEGEKMQQEAAEERAALQAVVAAEKARKAEEKTQTANAKQEAKAEAAALQAVVAAEKTRMAEEKTQTAKAKQEAKAAAERKEKVETPAVNLGIGGIFGSKKAPSTSETAKKKTLEDPNFVSEDLLQDTGAIKTTPFTFPTISIKSPFKKPEPDIIVPKERPISLEVASIVVAAPEKVSWGGEDAVFTLGRSFGVFDGVSGAEKEPGIELYSRCLAQNMRLTAGSKGLTIDKLTESLLASAERADEKATGASTALVGSIGEDGLLRMLNVGDCKAIIIRDGVVVRRTKDISHYFDCPYQLSDQSPDRPKDGTKLKFEVLPGDIIISGSDGVFDNLADDDICSIVESSAPKPANIVKAIANESRRVSLDEKAPTPYAVLAKRNKYEDYKDGLGGKVDDISCVAIRCS
jgi:protein phosphatase PTC7